LKSDFPRLIPFLVLVIIPILVAGILLSLLSTSNPTWKYELYYYQYNANSTTITDEKMLEPYSNGHIPENQQFRYYPYSLVVFDFYGSFECTQHSNISSAICPDPDKGVITKATITKTYRVGIFFPIPLLSTCLLYGFYPLRYHTNDYFKKKGPKNAIAEYSFVKNILYIGIPLMVIFGSIHYVISTPDLTTTLNSQPLSFALYAIVYSSQISLQYSVTAAALWMFSQLIKKDFRYYLAKAYIESVPHNDDDTRKMNLLIMAVNSYNKYLVKLLRLQINTLRVYYAFVNSNGLIGDHIQSLFEAFNTNDKLMPARCMSQITNVQKPEEFFAKESLSTKIVTWGALVGTILPIAISIFQLFAEK
jgi:hypothetical protein